MASWITFPGEASISEIRRPGAATLLETDLFGGLTAGDLQDVRALTAEMSCERGWTFDPSKSAPETLFILKEGSVQLYGASEEGGHVPVDMVRLGSSFGEMSLLSQTMNGMSAECIEDCRLCVLPISALEALIGLKPIVALNVVQLLAARLSRAEERLEMTGYGRVRQRLAALLLKLAGAGQEVSGRSHQQLAEEIWTARETVTRVLADFKVEGFIHVGRRRIVLTARRSLEEIASCGQARRQWLPAYELGSQGKERRIRL
jgi:CRP-like cAMP-binding protein